MTKTMNNDSRKTQLRKGFELSRIPTEVSKNMSPEDQKKMHITASKKEINFAKEYLIKETQKLTYPEEYKTLEEGEFISANHL